VFITDAITPALSTYLSLGVVHGGCYNGTMYRSDMAQLSGEGRIIVKMALQHHSMSQIADRAGLKRESVRRMIIGCFAKKKNIERLVNYWAGYYSVDDLPP
jgi:hypothetical protein